MVELAVATGIPVAVWAEESSATIATALEVIEEISRNRGR